MSTKKGAAKKVAAKKTAPRKRPPQKRPPAKKQGEEETNDLGPHIGERPGIFASPTPGQRAIDEAIEKVGGLEAALSILKMGQTRTFQPISATAGSGGRDLGNIKQEEKKEEGVFVNDIRKISALVVKQLPYLRNLKEILASVGVFQQPEGSLEKEIANLESLTTGRTNERNLSSHLLDVQEALRIHALILEDLYAHAASLFKR